MNFIHRKVKKEKLYTYNIHKYSINSKMKKKEKKYQYMYTKFEMPSFTYPKDMTEAPIF